MSGASNESGRPGPAAPEPRRVNVRRAALRIARLVFSGCGAGRGICCSENGAALSSSQARSVARSPPAPQGNATLAALSLSGPAEGGPATIAALCGTRGGRPLCSWWWYKGLSTRGLRSFSLSYAFQSAAPTPAPHPPPTRCCVLLRNAAFPDRSSPATSLRGFLLCACVSRREVPELRGGSSGCGSSPRVLRAWGCV